MSNAGNIDMIEVADADVKGALEALKDVRQKFDLIRSQHILSEAVHLGDSRQFSCGEVSIPELEEEIDRLCIQERAVQYSLECDTILKIKESGVLSSELQELLNLYVLQESEITIKSSELAELYSDLQNAQNDLSQILEEYMSFEKKQSQQFKEISLDKDKERMQKVQKQLKEIRFMQLIIPQIISQLDGDDLTEKEWLVDLGKEIRDPTLSIEDLK